MVIVRSAWNTRNQAQIEWYAYIQNAKIITKSLKMPLVRDAQIIQQGSGNSDAEGLNVAPARGSARREGVCHAQTIRLQEKTT